MTLDEFIEEVCQRPLPKNPMGRIRTLAKELAEGAVGNLWSPKIEISLFQPVNLTLKKYLEKRWGLQNPKWDLLQANGYLSKDEYSMGNYYISPQAFELLDIVEPTNIFISYKRSESSAFALLVLARLKAAGLEPFVDLAIEPGDQWHNQLEERIQSSDYFIVLLGKNTLKSEITCKEIEWAIKYNCRILPIWHNRFKYISGKWAVSSAIDEVINEKHAIRVLEESALAYNNAIVELLNKFGITP